MKNSFYSVFGEARPLGFGLTSCRGIALSLLSGLALWTSAPASHAETLGSVSGFTASSPTDGDPPFVLFTSSDYDIPSAGLITGGSIFSGASGTFNLILLDPLGSDEYKVVAQQSFASSGDDAVQSVALTSDWSVTPNEILAYQGIGASLNYFGTTANYYGATNDEGQPDYTGADPATGSTITLEPGGTPDAAYADVGTRDYAVSFDFTSAPEPNSLTLAALGGMGLLLAAFRRLWLRKA